MLFKKILRAITSRYFISLAFIGIELFCIFLLSKRWFIGYFAHILKNISKILLCDIDNINIKATTEEKLGFTGDGSGMAGHAVVLLEKINWIFEGHASACPLVLVSARGWCGSVKARSAFRGRFASSRRILFGDGATPTANFKFSSPCKISIIIV